MYILLFDPVHLTVDRSLLEDGLCDQSVRYQQLNKVSRRSALRAARAVRSTSYVREVRTRGAYATLVR